MERCVLGLHFFFLHLRALSNLRGHYYLNATKKKFLACNCVISSHRIKCNISIERSHQYLHFSILHQQALSNLRGHYDIKTEENADTFLVTVSFIHTESNVIPLLKVLIKIFPFLSLTALSSSWGRYAPKTMKIWWFNCAMCSLIDSFCSMRLVSKTTK